MTQQAEGEKNKGGGAISETVSVIVQALILAIVVRTLLFQPFTIPSGSMLPNLLVGDYLFVSKFSYGYSRYSFPFAPDLFDGRVWKGEPRRGDIVVFKLPRDPRVDYIKRLVGLPGDRIQMIDGELHINGEAVRREPKGTWTDNFGQSRQVYVETLPNGVSYETIDLNPRSDGDNTQVFEVPPDHYFFMGDNRDNSLDSRWNAQSNGVGYVPFENLVGPAQMIFFSVDNNAHPLAIWRWPADMRWSRLFTFL
ncbi:MAG: signal peptidase I [Pseudomonadota bacterium]|nr:signal peptidase I [Pseudomonadota bacterium]